MPSAPQLRILLFALLSLALYVGCKKNNTTQSATPTVSGISPSSDTVGAKVIITGNNFSPTTNLDFVEFNGVNAIVSAATKNQLTVIVPNGVTTGPVTVNVNGITATSSSNFTVADFSITEFAPSIAYVGYSVIIKGSQFDPIPFHDSVSINGTQVMVSYATDSTLLVGIPESPVIPTSGKIVVSTTTGRKYSSASDLIIKKATVTTISGFQQSYTGQPADGPLNTASFSYPGMAFFDPNGVFYFADLESVRKISTDGTVSTVTGIWNQAGNKDGPVSTATFLAIGDIAMDKAGDIYVSNTGYDDIRKIDITGNVTTIAGQPNAPPGWSDGMGTGAAFNNPQGIAVDGNNNIYVADCSNNSIRKISPAGLVTTFAGSILRLGGWGDGQGTNASFNQPTGMVIDQAGNLYVTEPKNSVIRKITPSGNVTTLAGSPGVVGTRDGQGADARFDQPTGITIDGNGNLYVTDYAGCTIRMITPGGMVSTLAGNGWTAESIDGVGPSASFGKPDGIAVNNAGTTIYVLDFYTHVLRKIAIQ